MEYNMAGFMSQCVDRYKELAPGARLRPADTPFLPEDQADSPYSEPAASSGKGKVDACPHCNGSIHEKHVYEHAKDYEASVVRQMKY